LFFANAPRAGDRDPVACCIASDLYIVRFARFRQAKARTGWGLDLAAQQDRLTAGVKVLHRGRIGVAQRLGGGIFFSWIAGQAAGLAFLQPSAPGTMSFLS
jgi:hypothetical protein